jgi:LmbE family N-acetylglucosaminyl deacetylase
MKLHRPDADIFIPDGRPLAAALAGTTHMGIGAHQDDLEFFAIHGILECYERPDRWFTGVTVTDGGGSARSGLYERLTDAEMIGVRRTEQRKAAMVGGYAAMIQLDYPSALIKDPSEEGPVRDLAAILDVARPQVLYVHNPADKHATHVVVLARSLEAVRSLPPDSRPQKIYGCEVWRDLDWLPDARKAALPVSDRTNLQAALNGVFDSQISGGKRYDLAVMGRRLAHATFHESHATDRQTGLVYAIDLTALADDDELSLESFALSLVNEFADEVRLALQTAQPKST